jgi:hypothetical protein
MTEHVELWLRSASSWTVGRDGTFVDDLEALAAQGVLEDYEVLMWGEHVPVEDGDDLTAREQRVRDRVDAVRAWADERGYDLPALSRTTKVCGFGEGPSYEATVLPLAALLGFEDGELQWVAPYSDGEEHVAVQDRLDELAARSPTGSEDAGRQPVEAE